LLVEVALIDMASSEPLVPIAELLERIEAIESKRGGGGAPAPRPAPAKKAAASASPSTTVGSTSMSTSTSTGKKVPADVVGEWTRVVGELEKRARGLFGHYARAKLVSWNEAGIELAASSPFAREPDTVKDLKRVVGEILGVPVEVKVKEDTGGGAKSVAEVEAEKNQAENEKREKEARGHPLTEKVIQTFGASIKEIKLDG
jgi:hypothetical protein